jgi:hypothetical protein
MSTSRNRPAKAPGRDGRWWKPRGATTASCNWVPRIEAPPTTSTPRSISTAANSARFTWCASTTRKVGPTPSPVPIAGPAPQAPYNENHHNGWNHFWRFSGGDIINDGVHQLDLARWLVGKSYPKTVYSVGGRFNEEGVFETPDTQVAVYEFDDLVMTFELTLYTPYMLKSDHEVRNRADLYPYWPQNAERIEIYGSQGLMYVGRHGCGWQVYDRPKSRQPVLVAQEHGTFPDPEHKENFCQAIRSRGLPSADIEEGHKSTLLCQYANISYRLGGEKLFIDPQTETCQGNAAANALLKREYRSPYVVPDQV